MRVWSIALAALLAAPAAMAGADAPPTAATAAKKDKKAADKPAKVYTDEDLKNAGKNGSGGAVTFLAEPDPAAAATDGHSSPSGASAESGASTEGGSSEEGRQAASEDGGSGEQDWRARAAQFRADVRTNQAEVARLEAALTALTNPQQQPSPTEALQPRILRGATKDENRIEIETALEVSRGALAEAQRALDDFLEDARRQNVPPGWVEER